MNLHKRENKWPYSKSEHKLWICHWNSRCDRLELNASESCWKMLKFGRKHLLIINVTWAYKQQSVVEYLFVAFSLFHSFFSSVFATFFARSLAIKCCRFLFFFSENVFIYCIYACAWLTTTFFIPFANWSVFCSRYDWVRASECMIVPRNRQFLFINNCDDTNNGSAHQKSHYMWASKRMCFGCWTHNKRIFREYTVTFLIHFF